MFQLNNEQRVFVVEQKYAPDLSPLDYFLRGHVKEKVFQSELSYVTALKQAIRKVISSIQPVRRFECSYQKFSKTS